jgi:hypothetical protein
VLNQQQLNYPHIGEFLMKPKELNIPRKRSLISLPKGNVAYLKSLNKFLLWIESSPNSSRSTFIEWLVKEESVSNGSAANYWQILGRLRLIEQSSLLKLSDFGLKLLDRSESEQAEILFPKLYHEFRGVAEIADLYIKYPDRYLHLNEIMDHLKNQFADWNSSNPYEACVHWLASLGFIEGTSPRFYKLSDFGRQLAERYTQINGLDILKRVNHPYGRYLIQELLEAARDGSQHHRFEEIVKEILIFLGFQAKRIGFSGDTDVIADSIVPENQYCAIFDTKARKAGKLTAFSLDVVLKHKKDHSAQYAVVVAEDFSQGSLVKYAEDRGVILMKIDLLCEWIALHCDMPLNLIDYRTFFETAGILSEIPQLVRFAHQQKASRINIISEIIEMAELNAKRNLLIGRSIESLHTALTLHLGRSLDRGQLLEVIHAFTHPALSWAVSHQDGGMILGMNRNNIVLSLRRVADELEKAFP